MRPNTEPLRPIDGVARLYPVDIRNAPVDAGQRRDTELMLNIFEVCDLSSAIQEPTAVGAIRSLVASWRSTLMAQIEADLADKPKGGNP